MVKLAASVLVIALSAGGLCAACSPFLPDEAADGWLALAEAPAAAPGDEDLWTRRVVARLASGDADGATRILEGLRARGVDVDRPAAAVARLLAGDVSAAGRLLFLAWRTPAVGAWLAVGAAEELVTRRPLAALALSLLASGDDPAGRAAKRVAVRALAAEGRVAEAASLVAASLAGGAGDASLAGGAGDAIPPEVALALPPSSDPAFEVARGEVLLRSGRAWAAVPVFAGAVEALGGAAAPGAGGGFAPEAAPGLLCRAQVGLGLASVRTGQRDDGLAALVASRLSCAETGLPAEAVVLLARLAFVRGDAATLDDVLRHVNPSVAAREGLSALPVLLPARGDLGRVAGAVRRRLARWPFRDPVAEEVMAVFAPLEKKGRLERAAEVLGPLVDAGYQAPRRTCFAQLEYWLGEVERRRGDLEGAAAAWEKGARRDPLSWYGLLSLTSLADVAPDRAIAVRLAAPAAPGPERVEAPPALEAERAARLLGLARFGLVDGLAAEAKAAGLDRDPDAAAWVAGLLADAGAARLASAFAHEALDHVGATTPLEGHLALWRAAYPTPFPELVRPAAERAGIDPFLVWAVMRIESHYDATAESHAGARGLLQLMPGTADWLLDTTEVAGAAARAALDLLDPAHNVALGTDMLARLAVRFEESTPLMLAAYNAGPTRVARWLERARDDDLVRFVEALPYDEARDYTRSVLGAWAVYQYLYGCGCLADVAGLL